jgi:hypothetical protein
LPSIGPTVRILKCDDGPPDTSIFKPRRGAADNLGMPLMRNRIQLASAACFVLFAVLSFTVSTLVAFPALVVGVVLSLRARAARP